MMGAVKNVQRILILMKIIVLVAVIFVKKIKVYLKE